MPKIQCKTCTKWQSGSQRVNTINSSEVAQKYQATFPNIDVRIGDKVCESCRAVMYRSAAETVQQNMESDHVGSQSSSSSSNNATSDPMDVDCEESSEEDELIEIHYNRVAITERVCFVCGSSAARRLVPPEVRRQAFLKRRLFIPARNRCCPSHLIRNKLFEEDLMQLRVTATSSVLTSEEVRLYMELLSTAPGATLRDKIATSNLTDEQIMSFTGLTYDDLETVARSLTSMRNMRDRSVIQALVIFLFKLRTGTSNETINAIFELQRPQYVSEIVASVMSSFEKDVLPKGFGFSARSRTDLIENETSPFVRELYGTSGLALIYDGTYLRHGKSANNAYQRKSYSGQKKTPLCKPFTICTTTGYIVDMLWPSEANRNDAQIMQWALANTGLGAFLERGDVCFVDRGFRDVKDLLENERGLTVLMPTCKSSREQLTAEEANASRFVTKIRWAVEAVHGIIKQKYRIFDHRVDNNLLPKIGTMLRIVCYLNNCFGKRLTSDESMYSEVVQRMKELRSVPNSLGDEVRANNWNAVQRPWIEVSSDSVVDFPELSEDDLKILFTGTYQLSQAVSYLAEMMDEDGKLTLKYHRENSHILKIQVQSRHQRAKQYRCYVDYVPDSTGVAAIRRHYCECKNGARTVGCCSHIAAVIYYLSHARYLAQIVRPAAILSSLFNRGAEIPAIEEDSGED